MSKKRLTTLEFIERSNIKHNYKYDYSISNYTSGKDKISIICTEHGEFSIRADAHRIDGQGCPSCRRLKASITKISNRSKTIVHEFKLVHGDKYSYDKFIYSGNKNKSTITCLTHGDFNQTADAHLAGKGCLLCASSNQLYRRTNYVEKCEERYGGKSNLYILMIEDDDGSIFYKVGITVQEIKSRFSPSKMPYDFIINRCIKNDAKKIFDLELILKKKLSNFRYKPIHSFGGSKYECFTHIPDDVYRMIDSLV